MANFAARVAARIRSNPSFQRDFSWLCARGIAALAENKDLRLEADESADDLLRLTRLVESASCLALAEDDVSHQFAQTIALYAVASDKEPGLVAACGHILSELGNFPASTFVQSLHGLKDQVLPPLIQVRDFARRYQNTVTLPGGRLPLTDFQFDIWSDLVHGRSTAISAPTSAGKSFVVRAFVVQKVKQMPAVHVAYIVPTRALMAEVQEKLTDSLNGNDETLRVTSVPVEDAEQRPKQVFVVTQERLLAYLDEVPTAAFDFVVVDEAQQMGDGSRGMILQDCLERINKANPRCGQYFIAPMASRVDNLAAAVGRNDVATHLTTDSPVVSTKIVVKPSADSANELTLEMLDRGLRRPIGRLYRDYGFGDRRTLLTSVCTELGTAGGSLIYASGPADAETTALQIAINLPERDSLKLRELSRFVREHVHKDYSLAFCVLRGVGFHYGSMPTLLRQALEDAFRDGSLSYLACTTTLFQGVNLPARNVFIDKVRRGRSAQLEDDDVWNFVGRAGRLMNDVAGNVFLVDYDNWPAKQLDTPPQIKVEPALSRFFGSERPELEQYIKDRGRVASRGRDHRDVEAAAGLLLNRVRKGSYRETVRRCAAGLGEAEITTLEMHLQTALEELDVPASVTERNWLISPWRLEVMFKYLATAIADGTWKEVFPAHPMLPESYSRYERMFVAIETYLVGKPNDKWARYLNYQANAWMKGATIATMVEKQLQYSPPKQTARAAAQGPNSDSAVRKIFTLLETTLRFRYVQLTRAYCDCFVAALRNAGMNAEAERIYPVALSLELGACTKTVVSLIELGLSRISAQALSGQIRGSDLTAVQVRDWLRVRRLEDLPIARVVLDELVKLRLLKTQ
ncbi:DEAD/DEAH box helicase [Caballeronia sp. LZ019]|uniref:DEAD/DEAH box helicase n=1 Tax=Caballeronia sp. LZ019 TaxID=3038555 RepID=UPI002858B865|nr:DEAD/DEAH box helicase [Caballeronia sp. LZ019]MDR5810632.1 DEAD/DEAH box helicase [Caballeronia sp. LZ019]